MRRLLISDLVFGLSAAVVHIAGLLRVWYFEKGPAHYWHDLFFLTKLGAFLAAALISAYPTAVFLYFPPHQSGREARRRSQTHSQGGCAGA